MQLNPIQFILNYPLNYNHEEFNSLSFLEKLVGIICFSTFSFFTLGGLAVYQFYNRIIRPKVAETQPEKKASQIFQKNFPDSRINLSLLSTNQEKSKHCANDKYNNTSNSIDKTLISLSALSNNQENSPPQVNKNIISKDSNEDILILDPKDEKELWDFIEKHKDSSVHIVKIQNKAFDKALLVKLLEERPEDNLDSLLKTFNLTDKEGKLFSISGFEKRLLIKNFPNLSNFWKECFKETKNSFSINILKSDFEAVLKSLYDKKALDKNLLESFANQVFKKLSLNEFPEEILCKIFSFTDPKDRNLLLVSTDFYRIGWEWKDPSKILSKAIESNNLEFIKDILKHKLFNPEVNNNLAIRWASENGHVDVVKELLKDERVNPAANDNDAVRLASSNGHAEVVKELLKDERVNPAAKNNQAFILAVINSHLEVIKLLLNDNRVDPGAYSNHALNQAIILKRENHLEVIKLLLNDNRVDPADENNSAIRMASTLGNLEVVKLLLKHHRVDPADKDNFAIRWASANGHLEVVKELLKDTRVDPAADNNCAIQWASENGHTEVVKELLKDTRVDPTADNHYALIIASRKGHVEVVKLLLKYKRVESLENAKAANSSISV